MVFWIKQERNNAPIRVEDRSWTHSIYAASDDKTILNSILRTIDRRRRKISDLLKYYEFVSCYERITDTTKSEILKLTLTDSTKALTLARMIEAIHGHNSFPKVRLYNVDLPPAQYYFYERDIFPLAYCKVEAAVTDGSSLRWVVKDNVWSTDYRTPNFKSIHLKVNIKKEERKIPKFTDKIHSILLIKQNRTTIEIKKESEAEMIDLLVRETNKIDPDFIFTDKGDSFDFPYLIHRAEENGVIKDLILGRESSIPLKKTTKEGGGTSYFSYGRIYFKPTALKLLGRIHIDINNSFIYNDSGLEGLYEIARVCRMPLHVAARASIGKCLSSLQFYYATQKRILIPWKPATAEHFKTYEELFVADRGGFIFEPEIGVQENVVEFDFVSLYPNIMLKKNLSAETIKCSCCRPNSRVRVPELDYNICEKKAGIVPTSLKIVLEKRARYKELKENIGGTGGRGASSNPNNPNSRLRTLYDARQNSLKWILVTSFGYLGFNNAKFGRIDAHIAVCAFDRQIMLQVVKIAERHGFRVLHGIVDSIWVKTRQRMEWNNTINDENHKNKA